jgi:serine/threonine protein kinase
VIGTVVCVDQPSVPGLTGLQLIARGGNSTVYRASSGGRAVAVKVGSRPLVDDAAFLAQAELVGRVSAHPHIVTVYGAGLTADDHPYLVMELCDGSYADRLAADGPRPPREVAAAGVALAGALAHAHGAGVLHRDVKPGNVLLSLSTNERSLMRVGAGGTPRLADFWVGQDEALTPAYAAPEVFRSEPAAAATDVYALGATLYALLAGRPPRWPEVGTPSVAAVLQADTPVEEVPGVPAELTAVLRRAMAWDVEDRYASASELRDALAEVCEEPVTP